MLTADLWSVVSKPAGVQIFFFFPITIALRFATIIIPDEIGKKLLKFESFMF
jgi:hypothetical protein